MKKTAEEKPESKFVAFLRGINVGGHSVIRMEELRKVFESLGFRNVKTVLASGNVHFEAPGEDAASLPQKITRKLEGLLGREITVIVLSLEELRELEARQPFKNIDATAGARPIVTFVADDIKDEDISGLPASEGFRILCISGGAVCSVSYDQYGTGTAESMGFIEKAFGRKVTTRSWDTILKVLKASDKM